MALRYVTTSARRASKCSVDMGTFTFPQSTVLSVVASRTTNLSLADRPVYGAVPVERAPMWARTPSLRLNDSS